MTNFPPSTDPSWSPDGTKIVYVLGNIEIYVINADGTNQINLTNTQNISETNPSWSSAGKIVYERDNQIWTMNADGTNRVQFPVGRSSPTYSPDGTKVAVECCLSTFAEGIYTANADGNTSSQLRLTTGQLDDLPDWQPITVPRRTAFDFDGDGRSDISVFRPSDRIWYVLKTQSGATEITSFGISNDKPISAAYVR